ncbi:alpha/beta hydrolase [Micromonospora sp. WMMD975]|uniref:alpha/beta hydrolase n=1 Tax=Micromonospora sp. WMMD975 TaxID=3016087 RepID=UPI00249A770D|nr:alpha/beta hydrolase [Micromonospora sp. WMMD975]WFE35300.1 alpha/beta hydrolase [Micromonospora sp. WMMD975]
MSQVESTMRFRAADGSELPLLVFEPGDGTQPRAGVVLFHGGALREGSAAGLAPHCRRLAAHGIFAVSAGYRLLGRGAVSIDDCLADVRLAVERFGLLAASRGLEARHLASGGSSAGAHLALVAAMSVESSAAAPGPGVAGVVALNPAGLDLRSLDPAVRRRLEQQIGIAPGRLAEYSLIEFVRTGHPPMQIHHGTRDEVEPIDVVRRFRDAMAGVGNECTLIEYAHAGHGFHYPGHGGHFGDVMDAAAQFLLDRIAGRRSH